MAQSIPRLTERFTRLPETADGQYGIGGTGQTVETTIKTARITERPNVSYTRRGPDDFSSSKEVSPYQDIKQFARPSAQATGA